MTTIRIRWRQATVGGAVATVVSFALVLLLASPITGAASPSGLFRGSAWTPSLVRTLQGCAHGNAFLPKWYPTTGNGSWHGSGSVATCGAARGGSTFGSSSEMQSEIAVSVPFHPLNGTGGVNVSWDLAMTATTSATLAHGTACPTTNITDDYDWGYTWYNFTGAVAFCTVESAVLLYGFAYLVDQKTGASYFPSNAWSEPFNSSGAYVETYRYTTNYSNASFWAYNQTLSGSANQSWGPSGTLTGTFAPTWFINGTFRQAHRFVAQTYVYVDAYATTTGFSGARAAVSVNLATGGDHWDLRPLALW